MNRVASACYAMIGVVVLIVGMIVAAIVLLPFWIMIALAVLAERIETIAGRVTGKCGIS